VREIEGDAGDHVLLVGDQAASADFQQQGERRG